MKKVSIPNYTLKEELINSISHGTAAIFSVVALILCVLKANNASAIVSVCLYGTLMINLYVISCIYHALSPKLVAKKVLRVLDHCNVLLMVAGTYMPICLSLLKGTTLGWVMFGIVVIVTLIAIVFNAIDVDKYILVSVLCNLILGWGSLVVIKQLLNFCPMKGLLFLILGGVMYTIGSVLYGLGKKVKYMHSVFHFFVIAGSVFHFIFIYFYCI